MFALFYHKRHPIDKECRKTLQASVTVVWHGSRPALVDHPMESFHPLQDLGSVQEERSRPRDGLGVDKLDQAQGNHGNSHPCQEGR
jgi:hypothetical protein